MTLVIGRRDADTDQAELPRRDPSRHDSRRLDDGAARGIQHRIFVMADGPAVFHQFQDHLPGLFRRVRRRPVEAERFQHHAEELHILLGLVTGGVQFGAEGLFRHGGSAYRQRKREKQRHGEDHLPGKVHANPPVGTRLCIR